MTTLNIPQKESRPNSRLGPQNLKYTHYIGTGVALLDLFMVVKLKLEIAKPMFFEAGWRKTL